MATYLPTAEIGASYRCDGMGNRDEAGDYLLFYVEERGQKARLFKVSLGAAALLRDEIRGCLASPGRSQRLEEALAAFNAVAAETMDASIRDEFHRLISTEQE